MTATIQVFDDPEHADGAIRVTISGSLQTHSIAEPWRGLSDAVAAAGGSIIIDLAGLDACDGAGLGLLTQAEHAAREKGLEVRFEHAGRELEELLRMARRTCRPAPAYVRSPGPVSQIGCATADILASLHAFIAFLGQLAIAVPRALVTLNAARAAALLKQCSRVGADAVPVVSLLGGLVGFILAVQAIKALETIGGSSLVPMIVGFTTVREFGPLVAAIILAGRSGSAFAAELGTMKVTEELDAYNTLSLDPMVVLVAPRVIAGLIVTPLLTFYSVAMGVVGGMVPMLYERYNTEAYLNGVIEAVSTVDLLQATIKGATFGLIVSSLGCFQGLRTGQGADAVGASATRAVVSGIVVVLVADALISSIFYGLSL